MLRSCVIANLQQNRLIKETDPAALYEQYRDKINVPVIQNQTVHADCTHSLTPIYFLLITCRYFYKTAVMQICL